MAKHKNTQELDQRIQVVTRSRRREPDNAALLVERGGLHFQRFEAHFENRDISRAEQDCQSALEDYERALQLKPGDTKVLAEACIVSQRRDSNGHRSLRVSPEPEARRTQIKKEDENV